ncbi:MAG: AbrB/MazE/SpoVT family DNA-binding domain-containing protein [Planctomycetaceae bacterium]|nr:AbrB/MazE/SpoVT family DNA-binding domain-containing protein [Planctomycetaceae bacterium]
MKTHLVKIGNSRGVRLPKAMIEQVGLDREIELEVHGDRIIIRKGGHPRAGWSEAFREMAARGDDKLIDGDLPPLTSFDVEEWEW